MPEDRFSGIYPIVYALFGADGALDRAAMRRQAEACLRAGAQGMAALGLATEVSKLTPLERRLVMEWLLEDVGGRVPVAITVFGATPGEQTAFVRAAASAGAAWVILQPPVAEAMGEAELVRFFGRVMDTSPLPVAIQNAPHYLRNSLSVPGLSTLMRNHANFTILKGEGSALHVREIIEATEGRLAVFNGRGGLELPDCLRAGCAGLIPASECCDRLIEIRRLMATSRPEDEAAADRVYAEVLPLITFLMQSIDQFLCYGKRLAARRLGLKEVVDRQPCQTPTGFGLACLERHARSLPAFA